VLGDIFDGAFRIIRYNPKATVGAAVLVSAVAMVLPVVTALISGSTGALRIDPDSSDLTNGQVTSLVATFGSLVLGLQLQSVGLLFVSGMIAHVASAAAVGRKLTINEAWAATHGKRWRLFGMALLLGLAVLAAFVLVAGVLLIGIFAFDSPIAATVLVGIALGLMLVVAYVLFWVRLRALADTLTVGCARSFFGRDRLLHHHVRGLLAMEQGRWSDAEAELQQARWGVAESWTRSNVALAKTEMALHQPRAALAALRDAYAAPLDGMGRYQPRSELDLLMAQAFRKAGDADSARVYEAYVRRAWRNADPELRRLLAQIPGAE